jgi:hypothetical protein
MQHEKRRLFAPSALRCRLGAFVGSLCASHGVTHPIPSRGGRDAEQNAGRHGGPLSPGALK